MYLSTYAFEPLDKIRVELHSGINYVYRFHHDEAPKIPYVIEDQFHRGLLPTELFEALLHVLISFTYECDCHSMYITRQHTLRVMDAYGIVE